MRKSLTRDHLKMVKKLVLTKYDGTKFINLFFLFLLKSYVCFF